MTPTNRLSRRQWCAAAGIALCGWPGGGLRSVRAADEADPYDAHIAAGSAIVFRDLHPGTRLAARELAASVVEGLRSVSSASAA